MAEGPDESDRLREELRLCRLELAQVRAAQEPLLEDLAEARQQQEAGRNRLVQLSRQVNDLLMERASAGDGPVARTQRWVTRHVRWRREWNDVETLRASELFNGPWYLRHHPEVVGTGLPPALHYLRHGAAQGLDPSPRFDTSAYLASHEDVAASGVNPLLHHLRSSGSGSGKSGS